MATLHCAEKRVILDLDEPIHSNAVLLRVGDTADRIIARFMQRGEVYHIADGTTAKIRFGTQTCDCEVDGDEVSVVVPSSMLQSAGVYISVFVLTGTDNSVVVSSKFTILVEGGV